MRTLLQVVYGLGALMAILLSIGWPIERRNFATKNAKVDRFGSDHHFHDAYFLRVLFLWERTERTMKKAMQGLRLPNEKTFDATYREGGTTRAGAHVNPGGKSAIGKCRHEDWYTGEFGVPIAA